MNELRRKYEVWKYGFYEHSYNKHKEMEFEKISIFQSFCFIWFNILKGIFNIIKIIICIPIFLTTPIWGLFYILINLLREKDNES